MKTSTQRAAHSDEDGVHAGVTKRNPTRQVRGASGAAQRVTLRTLVGCGDRIGLVMLPFVVLGVVLNVANPALFAVGGPPTFLLGLSIAILIVGITCWAWSVVLILTKVPRGQLITSGPYALVKHPLYTGVSLLVLPWLGMLFNTWLGVPIGVIMYFASRRFESGEEEHLSRTFATDWERYRASVRIKWL